MNVCPKINLAFSLYFKITPFLYIYPKVSNFYRSLAVMSKSSKLHDPVAKVLKMDLHDTGSTDKRQTWFLRSEWQPPTPTKTKAKSLCCCPICLTEDDDTSRQLSQHQQWVTHRLNTSLASQRRTPTTCQQGESLLAHLSRQMSCTSKQGHWNSCCHKKLKKKIVLYLFLSV